jgi:predicted peroxiredoxin
MEKYVNKLIDHAVCKVDRYVNNGSTWLIFTEDKKWVIELTKEGTLWYNYNFFKTLFRFLDLDVVENQHYITKWVEDTIINGVKHLRHRKGADDSRAENIIQNGVIHTSWHEPLLLGTKVEDTIQNGVKSTKNTIGKATHTVEDTIQNGVKHTLMFDNKLYFTVENTIQNGVKETIYRQMGVVPVVENTIQNGVKETHSGCDLLIDDSIEDTIQNGVKHTIDTTHHKNKLVEDTLKNGVKHTRLAVLSPKSVVEEAIQSGVKETELHKGVRPLSVNDTIENGIKETKTPGADGDIMGAVDFMSDNNTNNLSYLINDIIQNGVKETKIGSIYPQKYVEKIMQNAVKKTYSDKIPHEYDWSDQFTEDVEYTIQNGVKHTEKSLQIDGSCVIEDVVKNGIKETHDDVYHHKGRIEGVIKNSTKLN